MAGSNWDEFAVNLDGTENRECRFEANGAAFEIYKNYLYVGDPQGWRPGLGLITPLVMQIWSGSLNFHDVNCVAWRGPQQGVFAALWTTGHDCEIDQGIIGCGVYGFADDGKWLGASTKEVLGCLRYGGSDNVPTELLSALDKFRPGIEDPNRPRCESCGGDLGGRSIGRLESHKAGCPRFPL